MRTKPCSMLQPATFMVEALTQQGELVAIVGDVEQLGIWAVEDAVELYKNEENLWSTTLLLPADKVIHFRYLVVMNLFMPEKKVVVRRWEALIKPRYLESNYFHGPKRDKVDTFGSYDGMQLIEPGWLTNDTVIQFKIYNNPITFWKKKHRNNSFKMTIKKDEFQDDEEDDDDDALIEEQESEWPVVEIAVMNETECNFVKQEPYGHRYAPDDYVIFQVNIIKPETIGYNIQFFNSEESELYNLIGSCSILPNNLVNTSGTLILSITGLNHATIGHVVIEYLVVKPLDGFSFDARVSYAHAWHRNKGSVLDVGHRGAGNARRKDTIENVLENTVASFNYAAKHGADMVELDVQLSSDLIPVIYHDYNICVSMKKKKKHKSEHELLEIAIRHLTANQLQSLNLSPVKSAKHEHDFEDDDSEDNQPFPTLRHVLEAVDPNVGFNIEVKCAMQLCDGSWEAGCHVDLNNYIDIILREIFEYVGSRTIILSCFHPDICVMMRLKQNKYPLLFLTQGMTEKYPPYYDTRTSSIPMGAYFARSMNFLGINVHAEDLLRHSGYTSFVKSHKLVLFCWGEDINCQDILANLKEQGVDGVVYDKIDELTATNQVFLCDSTTVKIASQENRSELSTSSDSASSSG